MSIQEREHAAPTRPMWSGIYDFPWRIENLRVWVLLAIGLTILILIAAGLKALGVLMTTPSSSPLADMTGGNSIIARAAAEVFVSLALVGLFLSLYPCGFFLCVVEETAAGLDQIKWPDAPWHEYVPTWLYLGWLLLWSFLPSACLVVAASIAFKLPVAFWWMPIALLTSIFFPILLLSAMAAGAAWKFVNPSFLAKFLSLPVAEVVLYVNSTLFLVPCAAMAHAIVIHAYLGFAPLFGIVAATCLLWYARIVGRVGWLATRSRKRKKRRQVEERDEED